MGNPLFLDSQTQVSYSMYNFCGAVTEKIGDFTKNSILQWKILILGKNGAGKCEMKIF